MAATGLDTEATWNTVFAVTAVCRAAFATPNPRAYATRPDRTTATDAPGTLWLRSASATASSSARPNDVTLAGS